MFSRLALVGLMFLGLSSPCRAAIVLSFMEFSEVSAERIRVSDIATVKGDMPGVTELLNLDLGQAPYPGRVDRVKVASVIAWIKRRLPQFEQLQWEGPAEVALRTKEHTIPFVEVADLTHKTLIARLGIAGKIIELDSMARRKDLVVPDRAYQLTVARIEMDRKCQRLTTVTQAVANSRIVASLPLQFALVAEPKDAQLNEMADSEESNLSSQSDEACNKIRKAILEQQQQGNGYAIRQLSPITVELRTAGLTLETSGIALGNASVGDLVRVRPTEGPGQYLAKVIAPGRVFVTTGISR
ncbi:flagella basal body P-ring formation protein FlgA [Polaromonas sp. A23]|uniref:flagella basal body P-ring formation protein FlgA n=1 Tax=Polaromonas sp. A23 TaxID=1944133 RepID=UPI0009D1F1FB|nr:flagella basal body P-ring formation protein FlgA [Polaromonas sp. A23]OOG44448.1 hypothetical protein B0B52_06810 [Polaromonas sp. A23]